MTAPAIALMVLTILLVWGGLVASVVLLQVLSVPTDEETEAAQRAIEAAEAAGIRGIKIKKNSDLTQVIDSILKESL